MDHKVDKLDGLFSKLHPCFPTETKICIVGAGPSGISAAYALCKLGYSNVTLIEKLPFVSGMCESVDIQGKIYDLGGQVLAANSAPTIFELAKEVDAEAEEMDTHKFALISSSSSREFNDLKVVQDYVSMIPVTLKLQDEAKVSGREGVHGVSNIASDLTPSFLKDHGFQSIPKSVAYGYAACGYGFVQDMPYAYVHEFTRTSIAGKIRRFKGGYMSFWQKLIQTLPIALRCNTEVMSIKRSSSVVTVDVKDEHETLQTMEFDKIIISGSFPFKNSRTYRSPSMDITETSCELMDMSLLEKELFSKVKTIDYYTTVFKIKGLDHIPKGFYYFEEFTDNPEALGNPVAMQRFYGDTNIFLFWSYGNSIDIKGAQVTELAIKAVKSMGGQIEEVIMQRRFKYFPHVSSKDMKDGFYDKLECDLQGQKNTFFVGGLMAFELTERNATYSMALVRKHFADDSQVPNFPYVKRLMPMQMNGDVLTTRKLDESEGIIFPDLSSIDRYLNHWGTNALTQSKILYTWINEKGEKVGQRTYNELDTNASLVAYKLLTNSKPVIKPGDRVLLVYLPGLDFIDAFVGCLRARVIPVPVIPPDPSQRGGQALIHIANIAKTCGPVAILSTYSFHLYVRASSAKNLISMKGKSQWPALPWLHTDSWLKKTKVTPHGYKIVEHDDPKTNDLCFLQFTSGSTGEAKGVMISHGGLVHNVKLMRRRYNSTSKTVLVSWLPQYHDMGLIGGIFTSMLSGGSAVLFSPITFIKDPLLWLRVMSTYRATHSAGPNFAFELIVRRLESCKVRDLNLSSMVFLMVAAEPVRAKSLKRFVELTKPYGLSQEVMAPGYGLAENCVYVSSAFGESEPIFVDWQERVCCGYVRQNDVDVDIKIVDSETGKEQENSEVEGEIWITSLSSGIGYWGQEKLSATIFKNELSNHPGKKFLRSGDLGRIIQGKLFITGRIKDLIIIGGHNIYCSDVEKTVESTSEILRPGCCAVVAIQREALLSKGISFPDTYDQVGLVVIAEVRETKFNQEEIIKKIETRVAEEHGVIVASVVLVKPRTISKTTSGKIKRYECVKNFINGKLNVIQRKSISSTVNSSQSQEKRNVSSPNANISKEDVVNFLKSLLCEQTDISIDSISVTESLVAYGIDSIGVVRAAQRLSDFLGVPVGAIDIFTATCIDDLANFAENLFAKSRPQSLTEVPISNDAQVEMVDTTSYQKLSIWTAQILSLAYISLLLIFPTYVSVSIYANITGAIHYSSWFGSFLSLACAPLCWIACIFSTCLCIAFFGNSFLQPNYLMNPVISIWSLDFVKWWALYKVHDVSTKVLATHLRGTVFLNYWFKMLGAKITLSALLDATDITDPSLVSIGEDAVISEGALLQSHEVKNGFLKISPIKIGHRSFVGPYAVIEKGRIINDGAEVLALNTTNNSTNVKSKHTQKGKLTKNAIKKPFEMKSLDQFIGIYMVGFLNSLSAAITYLIYIWIAKKDHSLQYFSFFCVSGSLHWLPYTLVAYIAMIHTASTSPINFSFLMAMSYLGHGIILSYFTCITNLLLCEKEDSARTHLKAWFLHRVNASCHFRFAKLLSGTETFAVYLRLMGAKIGQNCSIRSINPVLDPRYVSIGDGVHLGDFSRITPGYYNQNGYTCKKIEIQENAVLGSQSLVLSGSVIERDVILGAISIAPADSVLRRGGIYVGSHTPVMVKNNTYLMDDRIEEMDMKYKKVLGNLAANLAATTMKVNSRYFHRVGVAGKGTFKIYADIPNFPQHKIFSCGKSYPIVIRHSNCLSSDDDARMDPRGAAIRILSNKTNEISPLLDLTLKTGNAFHAKSIGDFATWLVCGAAAREEHVKYAPHIRDAMWGSIRNTDSYADLHYYSNITRLFRFNNDQEMYVRFKLRPFDNSIGEDSGKVEPRGILPPETGALPRDDNDTRPLFFLADDFQKRVNSPDKIRYILQLQIRPIPEDENMKEIALDVTKPWDDMEYPYTEVGEILIDEILTKEESDKLEFNPFYRCHEVDVIRATSCNQSASIDHGRSIIYEICQHLRNRKPLPEAWRLLLDQSDVKLDLSCCPFASKTEAKDVSKVTLARAWYITLWLMTGQPILQTFLPYFLIGLVIFIPFQSLLFIEKQQRIWFFPLFWICSGLFGGVACTLAKWILVGKKKEGQTEQIWSKSIFMDTIWQAIRTLVGEYFMEMTTGSFLFAIWMKTLGSETAWNEGAYVDSMGALLNPEMVKVEENGSVERDALFFGHIYEGEEGKVKYGKITIKNGGFVGSRAIAMPGVIVESEGNLGALSLAMKGEVVM